MIQSDRFFNKLTLTNDNIPDDKSVSYTHLTLPTKA